MRHVRPDGPVIASRWSCVSHAYEPLRPALTPAGASLVTLIDMCSRPIGNLGCGSAEIQTRNSSRTSSASLARLLMSVCSSSAIILRPRWQFCSSTHEPCIMPCCTSLRAAGSCPWPIEMARTCFFFLRASSLIAPVGSEPARAGRSSA